MDTTTGSLTGGTVREASVVTDAEGTPIAHLYDRYRLPVGADAIADTMKAAIVAIEDRRFFDHDGVDYRGLARAVVSNAATGSPLEGQGASTLTMQYVKNYRLYALARTDEERRAATADTLTRKLLEVRLAHRIEDRLPKPEILARYLDLVYFGNGAYGVEAAARTYFGSTADRADPPPGRPARRHRPVPRRLRPRHGPGRRPRPAGRGAPGDDDRRGDHARRRSGPPPPPRSASWSRSRPPAPGCAAAFTGTGFFCDYVQRYLADAGISPSDLRTGGYTVRTTLDPEVQGELAGAVGAGRPPTAGSRTSPRSSSPEAARRPVLGLAANRDFGPDPDAEQSSLPLATAPLRGAGSVYKIFTAAAALERGLVEPDTEIDVPDTYTARSFTDGTGAYTVSNLGSYDDRMSLTRALATSPNTAFVALEDRLGSVETGRRRRPGARPAGHPRRRRPPAGARSGATSSPRSRGRSPSARTRRARWSSRTSAPRSSPAAAGARRRRSRRSPTATAGRWSSRRRSASARCPRRWPSSCATGLCRRTGRRGPRRTPPTTPGGTGR